MLISAAEVLRERGAAGVTIDEVLARSGAPRGSVYYHFPEGRNQLLTEALQYAGEAITEVIDVVLGSQEQFMLKERRTGRRRRRLTFVPTDDELVSVISRRFQR